MSNYVAEIDRSIAIIGGGLAGLAAAYDLGKQGFSVTLLESASELGGLASSFELAGAPIERFYHFICRPDTHLLDLVAELGIAPALHWRQVGTGYFHHDRLYSFTTPFDLIRFGPVPFPQRLRFGWHIVRSRYLKDWRALDQLSAQEWLVSNVGCQAYEVIWDPLLRVKFGQDAGKISAAWMWHRIWRVASSRRRLWERDQYGYMEHGSATLVNALVQKIKTFPNVKIITNAQAAKIDLANGTVKGIRLQSGDDVRCDYAISTAPLPVLTQIAPGLPEAYRHQLGQIRYTGVVCLLLRLRQSLTDFFWVNLNDPRLPFNGFIEYTRLNPRPDLKGSHLVYVPFYTPTSSERFRQGDQALFNECAGALQRVNPNFDATWVEEYRVFREEFAQAICHIGFARLTPPHETPVPNLYITDSTQFYPEDRSLSAAIRLGRHVAQLVTNQIKR